VSTFNGVRVSYELDRYAPGQNDAVIGSVATDLHTEPRGIVYCHGSGQLTADVLLGNRLLLRELGRGSTVHVGDLGGQQWGSDEHYEQIGYAVDLLETLGCTTISGLGVSMGADGLLNYIVRNPTKLACAALLIPLTDIVSARSNAYIASRWPEIDAIYGAPPNADYTGHNPIWFAGDIDPDLPMKIWWSSNDPLVYPATVAAFLAARPQTEDEDMGAVSHDVPVVWNPDVRRWLDRMTYA
jgi:hypothetical protein